MNKKEAIQWATQRGWTKADAERALAGLSFSPEPEIEFVAIALAEFAGPALKKRQSLQGAQRAQVTIARNRITLIEQTHVSEIQQQQQDLAQERSKWVEVLGRVYKFANKFGLKDPMVEDIIAQYSQLQAQSTIPNNPSSNAA